MSIKLKTIKEALLDPIDRDLLEIADEIADTIVTSEGTSLHRLESQIQRLETLLDRYNAAVTVLKDVSEQRDSTDPLNCGETSVSLRLRLIENTV